MQLFATISLATIVAEHIYFRYKSLFNIGTIIIIYDNLYCTLETIFLLELWQNRNSFSARDSKFGDCRIMKKSSAGPRISFPNRESNKVFLSNAKTFPQKSHLVETVLRKIRRCKFVNDSKKFQDAFL